MDVKEYAWCQHIQAQTVVSIRGNYVRLVRGEKVVNVVIEEEKAKLICDRCFRRAALVVTEPVEQITFLQ